MENTLKRGHRTGAVGQSGFHLSPALSPSGKPQPDAEREKFSSLSVVFGGFVVKSNPRRVIFGNWSRLTGLRYVERDYGPAGVGYYD